MVLKAIDYVSSPSSLRILDQLVLPHNMIYIPIADCEAAHAAIKSMKVRGAPAIALVAILALVVELEAYTGSDARAFINEKLDYLVTSRPTAVNLHDAAQKLKKIVKDAPEERYVVGSYKSAAEKMFADDVEDNLNIGRHGAKHILEMSGAASSDKISILTICNTGSLATAGYGTAYSVIYNLHKLGRLERAFFCETRPYNQGARLTSTELVYDKIPSTMVLDSSIAALLDGARKGTPAADGKSGIRAIVVGADRVARNGDTANKIGTKQLAILAHHFGIAFLVAAPWTTIDLDTASGEQIVVEERPQAEVRQVHGAIRGPDGRLVREEGSDIVRRGLVEVCGEDVDIWNPAFDVTPHALISGIVTERGVYVKNAAGAFELPEERARWQESGKLNTMTTSVEEAQ